ncbi:GerAB/ArcD/ProY family transporter [Paenibacillus sinopodophylli]|uniref:GerAB/ArcD/ProY family transporter n=1 Tax=Paenibacillus sinopodophylli TaxID=1837342 RepID=UPI00110CDC3A|nr:endospore germination permease [Paenibacillus sinopodophylli]
MERRIIINNFQMMSLIVISTIGTSSLYAPATLAHYAERNSWYLVLIGGIVGFFNLYVFLKLNQLYPGHNIITMSKQLLGPWLGGAVAFLLLFYLMDVTTWVLCEFSQFFIIALNPLIPQVWYLIAGVLMCAYAVYHGLEVFARVSEIVLIVTVVTFMAIYVLLINQYHPEYLLPVLEDGLLKPLKGTLLSISWFGDLMFVSMIMKHVRLTKSTASYAFGAVGITLLLMLMSVLSCTMVFGGQATTTFTYPSISLIQNIRIFRNIERFDAALVVVWVMSSFIKITAYFWSMLRGLTDWLNLKRPRMFIVPLAVCFVVCSRFKVWGLVELSSFYDSQAWYFVLFQLLLPSMLLGIALIKEKMKKSG